MRMEDALIAEDISAYLEKHENKSLLRFLTCGSVDDGKSTLIGRLLYDSRMIYEDQLEKLEAESKTSGTQGGKIDFSLLVDGLAAEREQGITIDVAYRFFSTENRKFIVADTPGHVQYTRNMATGASTADLAILMVDARKGILEQTRRHSFIAATLGIRHLVLAINKMDLVNFDQAVFDQYVADFEAFAKHLPGAESLRVQPIPLSALDGDNITTPSDRTPWYEGPTLLNHLDTVDVDSDRTEGGFRFPVQWVSRPDLDFRGFAGRVATGTVRPGDEVRILPSGWTATVDRVVAMVGDLDAAGAGESVTLTLDREVDCSRGDVIASAKDAPEASDQFKVRLLWMDEQAMLPGRSYRLKIGTRQAIATVNSLNHVICVDTLQPKPAKTLELNEFGVCTVSLDRKVAFDPYDENRETGGFILVDRVTNATVGLGLIDHYLRRASNIQWQKVEIGKASHSAIKRQKPAILWFTGLSGSGKSTIANLVQKRLHADERHTYLLDGDNVRHGLSRDLGFTDQDRVENVRRVAEVSKLMVDAGLITLVSFISPFRSERRTARNMVEDGEFFEIFVDTPLEVAESRDVKGLYAKARAGELENFTGISSPYEPPANPELRLDTTAMDPEACADRVITVLEERGLLRG